MKSPYIKFCLLLLTWGSCTSAASISTVHFNTTQFKLDHLNDTTYYPWRITPFSTTSSASFEYYSDLAEFIENSPCAEFTNLEDCIDFEYTGLWAHCRFNQSAEFETFVPSFNITLPAIVNPTEVIRYVSNSFLYYFNGVADIWFNTCLQGTICEKFPGPNNNWTDDGWLITGSISPYLINRPVSD